jgi:amino acid permease
MMHEGTRLLPTDGVLKAPATEPEGSAFSSFLGLATTMMGAVILTLPGTLEAVGVVPGFLLFMGAAWLTYQSFEMVCAACDATGEFSYESLSSRLFGAAGVWTVRILTLVLLFGSVVTYNVIAMDLFEPFLVGVLARNTIGLVFTIVAVPLCLPETIHELRYANLMVIVCILYILVALFIRCVQGGNPEIPPNATTAFTSELPAIAYALPIITLSFACQLNVPRAYQELGDRVAMRRVHLALAAMGFVCYVSFAVLGYVCFHGHPPSDILTGFRADDTLINGARLCLGVSMVLKTPMTFQPLRQAVELVTLGHDRESLPFRAAITIVFMVAAHLLAIASSDLGIAMSFIGALAGNLLTITVPGLFLYEISKGFYYFDSSRGGEYFSRRFSSIVAWTGVAFSIVSLTYLTYSVVAY